MIKPEPITHYIVTEHACDEMKRRQIDEPTVRQVLATPEQRWSVRPGRDVLQSRLAIENPAKTYLIRVLVDVDRKPTEVVTAYRTSKINKYWRTDL